MIWFVSKWIQATLEPEDLPELFSSYPKLDNNFLSSSYEKSFGFDLNLSISLSFFDTSLILKISDENATTK